MEFDIKYFEKQKSSWSRRHSNRVPKGTGQWILESSDKVFNKISETGAISKDWLKSFFIPLPKKTTLSPVVNIG